MEKPIKYFEVIGSKEVKEIPESDAEFEKEQEPKN